MNSPIRSQQLNLPAHCSFTEVDWLVMFRRCLKKVGFGEFFLV
ncbi:hypothetical protein [Acinetobacter sp. ANC 4633]|nr:hypothetical protein [Acinetobacter sp. ANC 4633]